MAEELCPKCQSPLGEIITTKAGKRLQRCSAGTWNAETRTVDGCDYVKWLPFEPETLEENCPKCGAPLLLTMTRFNKKMKKCSTATWDSKTKTAGGCDYVEWMKPEIEQLDEDCPSCGSKLVKMTTSTGKKMKKCSTGGWDRVNKVPTGCTYVEWLKE